MTKRSAIKKDLRTPKYRPRIVANRKRATNKYACRDKALLDWLIVNAFKSLKD